MIRLLAAVLALAACSKPRANAPALAPDFSVALVQGEAKSASSKDLRGKVVVLEFWATWCQPCVESIPKLNELAQQLAGKPVVFLSISDEQPDIIAAFLKRKPIAGLVAAGGADAFTAFGIRGRPTTIILDAQGRVAARTFIDMVDAKALQAVLDGKPISIDVSDGSDEPTGADAAGLASISISTGAGKSGLSEWPDAISATAMPLDELLSMVCGLSQARIRLPKGYENAPFGLAARFPAASRTRLCEAFLPALALASPLRLARKRVTLPVFLVRVKGQGSGLKRSDAHSREWSWDPGHFKADGADMALVLGQLESALGTPLIDETKLSGRYAAQVSWDPNKPRDLERAMTQELGLELVPAKRPIDVIEGRVEAASAAR